LLSFLNGPWVRKKDSSSVSVERGEKGGEEGRKRVVCKEGFLKVERKKRGTGVDLGPFRGTRQGKGKEGSFEGKRIQKTRGKLLEGRTVSQGGEVPSKKHMRLG